MKDLTDIVIDLMARENIGTEDAQRLLLYIAAEGKMEQKRHIVERVVTGDISIQEACELMKVLVGEQETPDARWQHFGERLEFERRMFFIFHVVTLIVCGALVGWFTDNAVKGSLLAIGGGANPTLTNKVLVFVVAYSVFFGLPQIGLFWVRMLVELLMRPAEYFPNTFSSSGNVNRVVWLLLLVFLNVFAALAFYFLVHDATPKLSRRNPTESGLNPPA